MAELADESVGNRRGVLRERNGDGLLLGAVGLGDVDEHREVVAVVRIRRLCAVYLHAGGHGRRNQLERVVAVGGHILVRALARADGYGYGAVVERALGEQRGGVLAGVVLIVAVVLVECEAAVALARIDGYGYRFARAAEVLYLAVFGQH